MKRALSSSAFLAAYGVCFLSSPLAHANAYEDVFGASPRVKALGGAGTALAEDFSATYYNPGNLGYCDKSSLTVALEHARYGLGAEGSTGQPIAANDLRPVSAFSIGSCARLPLDLRVGFLFSQGIDHPNYLDQVSPEATPDFVMYGQRLESMSVMGALGYRFASWMSAGVGVSILGNSSLRVANSIPILSGDQEASYAYQWEMGRAAAIHAGVQLRPTKGLRLAASYRSALYHKLEAAAPTEVEFAGVPVELQLFLESVTWFTPHQVAVGAAYEIDRFLVGLDLTWSHWSDYPGPFIRVTADADDPAASLLELPDIVDPGFSDTIAPRIGVEYRQDNFALRGGYALRPSPAPARVSSIGANILDGTTHTLSAGGRYAFDLFDDSADEDAAGFEDSRLLLDAFASVSLMPDETVTMEMPQGPTPSSFGGTIFNAGFGATMEF